MAKRTVDIAVSFIALILLSPLLAFVALAIKLDSEGPVVFRQERVGRGFRRFTIYKFRTMIARAPQQGGLLTCGDDPRITRVGRVLRTTKIDELPQLFNVLRGDMSIVGPRPEVPKYVEPFLADYEEIVSVRPGLTDMASLKFRDEASVLGTCANPEETYVNEILPEKLRLAKAYVRDASLALDLSLIFRTLAALVRSKTSA